MAGHPWAKIKKEYLAGGVSQRALAEKYGVSVKTVQDRARREQWTKLRRETQEKIGAKMPEIVSDAYLQEVSALTGALLKSLKTAAKQVKVVPVVTTERSRTEEGTEVYRRRVEYEKTNTVDKPSLKVLAGVLKDLNELVREQAAREHAGGDSGVKIEFVGEAEEFSE